WSAIDPYADFGGGASATISRGASKVESPVVRYDAGTASVPLSNIDRRFDPANLSGPYVAGQFSQVQPPKPFRISATYASITYRLFNGTVDAWLVSYSPPSDSVATVTATDGFKILGTMARKAKASFFGAGEDSGQRVSRIL